MPCGPSSLDARTTFRHRTTPEPSAPAPRPRQGTLARGVRLDELDPVAVRIAHEAQAVAALAHGVRRLLGLDALPRELGECAVEILGRDRDVVVAGAEVVAVDARVVGELEPRAVVGQAHEDVGRAIGEIEAADLLESERVVEGDGPVDVADPVTGVDEGRHHPQPTPRTRVRTIRWAAASRGRRRASISPTAVRRSARSAAITQVGGSSGSIAPSACARAISRVSGSSSTSLRRGDFWSWGKITR